MDQPPQPDEIEVTVLGRGYGESVVLHIGDGHWIVVDSFFDENGKSAPLAYLEGMGVDPDAIALILATHWHDDHVRGLGQLHSAARNAEMVFSLAMQADEFGAFLAAHAGESVGNITSGVKELLSVAGSRKVEGRPPVRFAQASTILYRKPPEDTVLGVPIEFQSLSPSPADIVSFVTSLPRFLPSTHATRVPAPDRNAASVAAWLSVGEACVLLGADLEEDGNELSGWTAIVKSRTRPRGKAQVFKIPHHGSHTGHCDDVWAEMVDAKPVSALAPWTLGGRSLPRTEDVDRIRDRSSDFYIAKLNSSLRFRSDPPVVGQMMAQAGAQIRSIPRTVGIVRLRKALGEERWRSQLFNGASRL